MLSGAASRTVGGGIHKDGWSKRVSHALGSFVPAKLNSMVNVPVDRYWLRTKASPNLDLLASYNDSRHCIVADRDSAFTENSKKANSAHSVL